MEFEDGHEKEARLEEINRRLEEIEKEMGLLRAEKKELEGKPNLEEWIEKNGNEIAKWEDIKKIIDKDVLLFKDDGVFLYTLKEEDGPSEGFPELEKYELPMTEENIPVEKYIEYIEIHNDYIVLGGTYIKDKGIYERINVKLSDIFEGEKYLDEDGKYNEDKVRMWLMEQGFIMGDDTSDNKKNRERCSTAFYFLNEYYTETRRGNKGVTLEEATKEINN